MISSMVYEKVFSVIAFLIMVAMNIIANLIPMNGMTTGELSEVYPTLITPANYTFLIWILIYLFLFAYTIYQLELFGQKRKLTNKISGYIRVFFIISCLFNAGWIVAWHYKYMALSLMIMIALFICLSFINNYLYKEDLSMEEKLFIRLPFGIYFGWITVAAVVNVAVLLVSIRWSGFGIPAPVWTIIAAALILFVTFYYIKKNKGLAYAATVIWAYIGILVKHTSVNGFRGDYPDIITATIICILMLSFIIGFVFHNILRKGLVIRCLSWWKQRYLQNK